MVNLGKIYLVTGSEMDTIFRWLDLLERHRRMGRAALEIRDRLSPEDREKFTAVCSLIAEAADGQHF